MNTMKRGLVLLTLAALAFGALYSLLIQPRSTQQEITEVQLLDLIKAGQVTSIVNEPDPSTGLRVLTGTYQLPVSARSGVFSSAIGSFKTTVDLQLSSSLAKEIEQAGFRGTIETQNNHNVLWPLFLTFISFVLLANLMFLFFGSLIWFLCQAALWLSREMTKT